MFNSKTFSFCFITFVLSLLSASQLYSEELKMWPRDYPSGALVPILFFFNDTDPCDGIVCDAPPDDECSGDALTVYEPTGTCAAGVCSYDSSDQTCDFGCIAQSGDDLCGVEPTGLISVASVLLRAYQPIADILVELPNTIDQILNDHGDDLDLIVTPEYMLTHDARTSNLPNYAIHVECDANHDNCSLSSGGGTYSDQVLTVIESITAKTVSHGVYLYLGTIAERVDVSGIPEIIGDYVYFVTMLIVDPAGNISVKRKSTGESYNNCPYGGSACEDAVKEMALATSRPFTVVTRSLEVVDVFTCICAGCFYDPMFVDAVAQGYQNLDLLVSPENMGDANYTETTEEIQGETWSTMTSGWWMIKEHINLFATTHEVIKPYGHMVKSGGTLPSAGIIQLHEPPTPIPEYSLQASYMFGKFPF